MNGSPGWTRTNDLVVNSHALSVICYFALNERGSAISANLSCFYVGLFQELGLSLTAFKRLPSLSLSRCTGP